MQVPNYSELKTLETSGELQRKHQKDNSRGKLNLQNIHFQRVHLNFNSIKLKTILKSHPFSIKFKLGFGFFVSSGKTLLFCYDHKSI